ncbi:(R)-mandelonitrile lyase [Paractinoplanes maris]|uniref:(R)-mandelonitrile lyase n=1 Tax=Paractinoplanes maris TaxID=1734446 RepID=UPI0020206721|nr:carboxymuconolactone decarboxylase family protein [Actinoplanes maris]
MERRKALGSNAATGAAAADKDDRSKTQTITRGEDQTSTAGSPDTFTGDVRVSTLFPADGTAPYSGASVTFQPGARSAWHTHPAGQRLVVTEGVGRTQQWGGPLREIRAGDVVWCPPGVKHWHGAAPDSVLTHVALTGVHDEQAVTWLEQVSDEQYDGRVAGDREQTGALSDQHAAITMIGAFTASGDLPRLTTALKQSLDAGVTVNQVKEVLVQMYAYAGFPRSLNAISTFMTVLEHRQDNGTKDESGPEPSPLPDGTDILELGTANQTELTGAPVTGPLFDFAPAIDEFLKAHLFGDIFSRDNLDWRSREIATIAALATLAGTESQLRSHFTIGLHTGLSEAQLRGLIQVLSHEVGSRQAADAGRILDEVVRHR